jgi:hypothetical protein
MLDYSELTIIKNADGVPTALGYPVNSLLLQNNKALFVGGGKDNKFDQLAVPSGLICMTETICVRPLNANSNADDVETIPDGLYEKLLALAETKPPKKLSRHKKPNKKQNKNKTRKA